MVLVNKFSISRSDDHMNEPDATRNNGKGGGGGKRNEPALPQPTMRTPAETGTYFLTKGRRAE